MSPRRAVYQKMIQDGKRIPSVEGAPEIDSGSEVYLEAFLMLSAARPINETGPQPIPMVDICALLDTMDVLDSDERIGYIVVIQACDSEYREAVRKTPSDRNSGREGEPTGRSNGRPGGRKRPQPPRR